MPTILIVEDEPLIRMATRAILEDANYTVLEAGDGNEGVDVFFDHFEQIDLVVLDIQMPLLNGREHEHIVAVLEKVRQAIGPHVDLAVDLHGSFNLADALRIYRDVEHLDLLWLEDPIRWEWGNVDALAKICMQTETPICTGELFYGAGMFRELLDKQACDLLEPDIPLSGGPIEIRRVAELADLHYMSSAVGSMAAVHICATIPNFLALEYHSHNIPLWSRMPDFKEPIQGGYIAVPDGPGLGIELDEEEIASCLPEGAPLWM